MRASRYRIRCLYLLLGVVIFSARLFASTDASPIFIKTTDFAPSPDAIFSIQGKAEMAVYQAFRQKYPNIYPEGNSLSLTLEGPAGEAPLLMSIAGRTAPNVIHVNRAVTLAGIFWCRWMLISTQSRLPTKRV